MLFLDRNGDEVQRRAIDPWPWMARLHLTEAVHLRSTSEFLLCSGQPSVDDAGRIVGKGNIRLQMETAMENLHTVLATGGFDLGDVVRLNLYTTDVDGLSANFDVITEALARAKCHPSNTLLGVSRLARPQMLIEIEATAAR
jgi:enamine deaminase RidA (YjgF/YER057c/UK114 family)